MKPFEEYVELAAVAHGHICAGQILGIRMAMHGLKVLGIDDPLGADRKRLITVVEIDRCATDAITVVTGCRLGKRSLKFRDYGKMAATFCDLGADRGVRVSARESAKALAAEMFPEIHARNQQQIRAYGEMDATDLFKTQWVTVHFAAEDLPGYKRVRAECSQCRETINYHREVVREDRVLCRACAGEAYYQPIA